MGPAPHMSSTRARGFRAVPAPITPSPRTKRPSTFSRAYVMDIRWRGASSSASSPGTTAALGGRASVAALEGPTRQAGGCAQPPPSPMRLRPVASERDRLSGRSRPGRPAGAPTSLPGRAELAGRYDGTGPNLESGMTGLPACSADRGDFPRPPRAREYAGDFVSQPATGNAAGPPDVVPIWSPVPRACRSARGASYLLLHTPSPTVPEPGEIGSSRFNGRARRSRIAGPVPPGCLGRTLAAPCARRARTVVPPYLEQCGWVEEGGFSAPPPPSGRGQRPPLAGVKVRRPSARVLGTGNQSRPLCRARARESAFAILPRPRAATLVPEAEEIAPTRVRSSGLRGGCRLSLGG